MNSTHTPSPCAVLTSIHQHTDTSLYATSVYVSLPNLREARQLNVPDPVRGRAQEGGELHVWHPHESSGQGELDAVLPYIYVGKSESVCVEIALVGEALPMNRPT